MGVLALAEILLSVWLADIMSKTKEKLYEIRPVACHADCVFRVGIPWCWAFCNKKMKLALSIFYVVNRVFSADKVLLFCFKTPNTPTSKGCNKCVECAGKYKYIILCSWGNRINLIDIWDAYPSTIKIWYSPRRELLISDSKQLRIHSIQSLLSVQPFSPSEIQASRSISLGYQPSFQFLPFKI